MKFDKISKSLCLSAFSIILFQTVLLLVCLLGAPQQHNEDESVMRSGEFLITLFLCSLLARGQEGCRRVPERRDRGAEDGFQELSTLVARLFDTCHTIF